MWESNMRQADAGEEKIRIWDTVPGNHDGKKAAVMEIGRKGPAILMLIRFILAIRGESYRDRKKAIDTYTALSAGPADPDYQETFRDQPYLLPYIAPGSRKAVIVVPGGGYCYKSMKDEGTAVAEALQKAGITAFVLWYRTNPYYMPLPALDMQRAVRYVRAHAADYGYDPTQVGAVGFSGGGMEIGLHLNLFQGKPVEYAGYIPDEIDLVDDRLSFAGLIYPALGCKYNVPLLFACFPAEAVRDKKKRQALIEDYDVVSHFRSADVPQYIGYGSKDTMVSIKNIEEYYDLLVKNGADCRKRIVEGAGHGYGASNEQYRDWLKDFIIWVKER